MEVKGWKSLNCKVPNGIDSIHWSTYSNWLEYVSQFSCDLRINHTAHRHESLTLHALICCATSPASVLCICMQRSFSSTVMTCVRTS